MKKMIFILAFALPVLCFGQNSKPMIQPNDSKVDRAGNEGEISQTYTFIELLVISTGKVEQVIVRVDDVAMKKAGDSRMKKELDSMRNREYNGLVEALNAMSQSGWEYLDSFNISNQKETMIKVILRKEVLTKKK